MRHCCNNRQRGLIMSTAVIFLLFLALLGVTLLQASALEQRMAGNLQQSQRAFSAAETGLLHAFRLAQKQRTLLQSGLTLQRQSQLDGARIEATTAKIGISSSVPRGYSLRGSFRSHHFSTASQARMHAGAQTSLAGGFIVVGPGTR